jgi:hypothetical protein
MGNGLRAVSGVRTKPGQITDTLTPLPRRRAQRLAVDADSGFAGAIGGRARHPAEPAERAHQRNLAAPARQHGRERRLDRVQHAIDVDGEHPAGLIHLRPGLAAAAADPGTGDHEAERSERLDRRDPIRHFFLIGDID